MPFIQITKAEEKDPKRCDNCSSWARAPSSGKWGYCSSEGVTGGKERVLTEEDHACSFCHLRHEVQLRLIREKEEKEKRSTGF